MSVDSTSHRMDLCAEETNSMTETASSKEETKLSKNKLKKLRKQEQKMQQRPMKRKAERERRKENIKKLKSEGQQLPPNRKQLKKTKAAICDVTVAVDCSFESYMTDNDIKKLAKQLQHCYAINRRSKEQFKYFITSFSDKVKDRVMSLDGRSWHVSYDDRPYYEVFSRDRLVYLSSDSDNMLTTIDPNKVYVIGGLVDHNQHKGLCHRLAVANDITHAQLPISQYVEMKTRKVLTIDHVFDILLKFHELKDWEKAFFAVIPKRKGIVSKQHEDTDSRDAASPSSEALPSQLLCDSNCLTPVIETNNGITHPSADTDNLTHDADTANSS